MVASWSTRRRRQRDGYPFIGGLRGAADVHRARPGWQDRGQSSDRRGKRHDVAWNTVAAVLSFLVGFHLASRLLPLADAADAPNRSFVDTVIVTAANRTSAPGVQAQPVEEVEDEREALQAVRAQIEAAVQEAADHGPGVESNQGTGEGQGQAAHGGHGAHGPDSIDWVSRQVHRISVPVAELPSFLHRLQQGGRVEESGRSQRSAMR